MSKWLSPGIYGASLTGVWIDDLEAGSAVVTSMEVNFTELERLAMMHVLYGSSTQNISNCAIRKPKLVHPEIAKLLKAQPTKPIHSHEPWKQSVKRQGRQIRKSK